MTTDDRFSRTLADWLHETAEHRVPDHLGEVLVQTVATHQRPWWSSPERWLPMDILTAPRAANLRPVMLLLLLFAMLLAVVGAAFVASQPQTSLTGLADNGRIYVIDGSVLMSYAADGTDGQPVVDVPPGSVGLSFSPDGKRLAYFVDDDPRVDVLALDGGRTTSVPIGQVEGIGGPIRWSPDGTRFLFNTWDGTAEHLVTAAADGTDVRELDVGGLGPEPSTAGGHRELWPVGWSPAGDRIAFVAVDPGETDGRVVVVRPDGTDLRRFATRPVDRYSVSWSPDPTADRLVAAVPGAFGALAVNVMDADSGETTAVGPGFWPSWSPDGRRIAYWTDGTVVVEIEEALAGEATPEYVFEVPAPTQSGMAPERYSSCQNPEQLQGNEICEPVTWSPDGEWVFGPDINGGALVVAAADGSGSSTLIDVASRGELGFAWQPIRP